MMKLLENLARNMDEWPNCDFIVQDSDGECWPSMSGQAIFNYPLWSTKGSKAGSFYLVQSNDNDNAMVNREQWQAERQRIAMEGISQFSQEQENMTIIDEFKNQHDRKLWEKIALEQYTDHNRMLWGNAKAASNACDVADAFMAERAKRMKDKQ